MYTQKWWHMDGCKKSLTGHWICFQTSEWIISSVSQEILAPLPWNSPQPICFLANQAGCWTDEHFQFSPILLLMVDKVMMMMPNGSETWILQRCLEVVSSSIYQIFSTSITITWWRCQKIWANNFCKGHNCCMQNLLPFQVSSFKATEIIKNPPRFGRRFVKIKQKNTRFVV